MSKARHDRACDFCELDAVTGSWSDAETSGGDGNNMSIALDRLRAGGSFPRRRAVEQSDGREMRSRHAKCSLHQAVIVCCLFLVKDEKSLFGFPGCRHVCALYNVILQSRSGSAVVQQSTCMALMIACSWYRESPGMLCAGKNEFRIKSPNGTMNPFAFAIRKMVPM